MDTLVHETPAVFCGIPCLGREHLQRPVRRATLPAMARRTRAAVVAIVVAIVVVAVTAVWLRTSLRCAGFAGETVSAAELPPPRQPGTLRVVTWNLRNFPLDERPQEPDLPYVRRTNICDLEAALHGLDADLLLLQEICDTRRFPPILRASAPERSYRVVMAANGGQFGQRVAVAWDDAVVASDGPPEEINEVALDPDLRPALAVPLVVRADGRRFTVVSVHLAAGVRGYTSRLGQYRALARWAAGRKGDLVVGGDFNTTGPPGGSTAEELVELDRDFGPVGLTPLPNASGCSAYWEGPGPPDGVQQPSLLDGVFVRGLPIPPGTELTAWLHCRRAGCGELVSRPGAEDATFWDVSDHCPLTFDVTAARTGTVRD